ncbi:MAG TPA: YigZ family protein, partial [Thermoanaerobaculia bacterium]|nr:YigZ family protein [Thermoanaerobaculia bacterium]
MASYLAPGGEARAEIREKGSRFLAVAGPAADEAAARELLASLEREFSDATHQCWAWRLGEPPRERSADAGEPAGTAGMPILQVLRGAGLSAVMAVVVRWFGGTKLGKGGLARAYAAAAREALQALPVIHRVPTVWLTLEVPYEKVGAVKRLIRPP